MIRAVPKNKGIVSTENPMGKAGVWVRRHSMPLSLLLALVLMSALAAIFFTTIVKFDKFEPAAAVNLDSAADTAEGGVGNMTST